MTLCCRTIASQWRLATCRSPQTSCGSASGKGRQNLLPLTSGERVPRKNEARSLLIHSRWLSFRSSRSHSNFITKFSLEVKEEHTLKHILIDHTNFVVFFANFFGNSPPIVNSCPYQTRCTYVPRCYQPASRLFGVAVQMGHADRWMIRKIYGRFIYARRRSWRRE